MVHRRSVLRPIKLVPATAGWTCGDFTVTRPEVGRRAYVIARGDLLVARVNSLPLTRQAIRDVLDGRLVPGRRLPSIAQPAAPPVAPIVVEPDDLVVLGDPTQVAAWARPPIVEEREKTTRTMQPREPRPDIAAMFPVDDEERTDSAPPSEPQQEQPTTAAGPSVAAEVAVVPAPNAGVALDEDGLLVEIPSLQRTVAEANVSGSSETTAAGHLIKEPRARVRQKKTARGRGRTKRPATATRSAHARLGLIAHHIELANEVLADELAMRVHALSRDRQRAVALALEAMSGAPRG